ncbi:hypothetical protein V6N13_046971 [Hibiscus sabdariffa]
MGGKGKDIDDTKDWPKANEVTLIQILVGKVREGKLQSSTFKKEVWAEINNEMHEAIGVDYGIDRLKGKFNRLRIKYRHFSELIGQTGVKWDVTSNTVHASQDIWEGFFKKNKDSKSLKNKVVKIMNYLARYSIRQLQLENFNNYLPKIRYLPLKKGA